MKPEHASTRLRDGQWFACDYPERPDSTFGTVYARDCRACTIAMSVLVAQDPHQLGYLVDKGGTTELVTAEEAFRRRLDRLGMDLPQGMKP